MSSKSLKSGDGAKETSIRRSHRIADKTSAQRADKRHDLHDSSRPLSSADIGAGSSEESLKTVRNIVEPEEERPASRVMSSSSRRSTQSAAITVRKRQLEAEMQAAEERARLKSEAAAAANAAARTAAAAAAADAAAKAAADAAAEESRIRLETLEEKLALQKLIIEAEVDEEFFEDDGASSIADDRMSQRSKYAATKTSIQMTSAWINQQREPQHIKSRHLESQRNTEPIAATDTAKNKIVMPISESEVPTRMSHLYSARANLLKDLPRFSGDSREWPIYAALFDQGTAMCGFTNADNLVRLQQSLQGQARDVVRAMLLDPRNVPDIRRMLERRFGRPSTRIDELMEEARRTPVIGVSDSMYKLVEFGTVVCNVVQSLRNMGHEAYLINPSLLKELILKLPQHLRLQWYSAGYGAHPTLLDFGNWLENILDAAAQEEPPKSKQTYKRDRAQSPFKKHVHTTSKSENLPPTDTNSPTVNLTQSSKIEKTTECLKCRKTNHKTYDCKHLLALPLNERWEWVKKLDLCKKCLRKGHSHRDCRIKISCGKDGCRRPHNTILHTEYKEHKNNENSSNVEDIAGSSNTVASTWNDTTEMLLRVASVEVRGPYGCYQTLALCDEGSTVTLIEAEIADKIGATGPVSKLNLIGASGMNTHSEATHRIDIEVRPINGKTYFPLTGVRTVNSLNLPRQQFNAKQMLQKWPHLSEVPLCDINGRPKLLIGIDHWHLIIPRTIKAGNPNGPIATASRLGWTLGGSSGGTLSTQAQVTHIRDNSPDVKLDDIIRDYFQLEELGPNVRKFRQNINARAEAILKATTTVSNDRWETGLLWKADDIKLPPSREMAERRLISVEKRLSKDAELSKQYDRQIQDFISKGYAIKLSPESKKFTGDRVWFLPHFQVENKNKPGKRRLVFDCAAKSGGTSLNDQLLPGPDLLNSLMGILFRFRQGRIAFTADIKEMFLQVRLLPEDAHSQRFLWRNMDLNKEPDEYLMRVVLFGSTSSPCSAQFVKNKNAERFEKTYPDAALAIKTKHYMDDYLDSSDDVKTAKRLIREVTYVHKKGGFDIVNWASNEPDVLTQTPIESQSKSSVTWSNEEQNERILGLKWIPTTDTLAFDTNFLKIPPYILNGQIRPSKRQTLQVVMSVFDPLGFLGPLAVKAKILLQNIWLEKCQWDEKISDHAFSKWEQWLADLHRVKNLKIPRCYQSMGNLTGKPQLHVFADASEKAYAAVAYARYTSTDGRICTTFIAGKNKVAPLKPLSLPRLELQAATLASRLAHIIKEQHTWEFGETILWSDSRTVLSWIQRDPRIFQVFVAHRLGEIDSLTNPSDWRWVPSKLNPADHATRDAVTNDDAIGNWIHGPNFLKLKTCDWPEDHNAFPSNEGNEELRRVHTVTVNEQLVEPIDIARFSKLFRLLRSTAWTLRFLDKCRKRGENHTYLSATEITRAEEYWLEKSQKDSFPYEIDALKNGNNLPKDSKLKFLNAYIDEKGILRVGGRLHQVKGVALEFRKPAILDSKHPYAKLIIQNQHEVAGHKGREFVANELRQRFWILRLRGAIRKIAFNCQQCRIDRAKPIPPKMADLPSVRLEHHIRPFTNIGLDFFGPVEVAVGRRREKRYGVLFCCMSTRAVHVEITHSLSTDATLMALKRMFARRGVPSIIYSDNGSNLHGTNNELKRALQSLNMEEIKAQNAIKNIIWHFITPTAAHMGGFYERLIQSVKRALYATLKEKVPRDETLLTLIAEAENSVNSRPLVHVSLDNQDEESLTPNHFLIGSSSGRLNVGIIDPESLCLKKQWQIAQIMANHFWNRFVKEYLPTLTQRSKWQNEVTPIKIGDLAFLVDPQYPRNMWLRGIITETFPGKDGQGPADPFSRPWRSPVPPPRNGRTEVRWAADAEDCGSVGLGWRGPRLRAPAGLRRLAACGLLLRYLAETPAAPLQRALVEREDALAGDVHYNIIENSETMLSISLENVPVSGLNAALTEAKRVIADIRSKKEPIDELRLQSLIEKQAQEIFAQLESEPHNAVAFSCIGDMLYSDSEEDFEARLNPQIMLQKLKNEGLDYWVNLLETHFTEECVCIVGSPSKELQDKMAQEEMERVNKQVADLGQEGLKKKEKILMEAMEFNEREPPEGLLASVKVPSCADLQRHSMKTWSRGDGNACPHFDIDNLPLYARVHHLSTNFVYMTVVLETQHMNNEQRQWLPLLLTAILECPVKRGDQLVPHSELLAELERHTVVHTTRLGMDRDGRCNRASNLDELDASSSIRFTTGMFSTAASVFMQCQPTKYDKVVDLMWEILYATELNRDRLTVIAQRMINDAAQVRRQGHKMSHDILRDLTYCTESNVHWGSVLRQVKFLTALLERLNGPDADTTLQEAQSIRQSLLSHAWLHLAADLPRHQLTSKPWQKFQSSNIDIRPPTITWDVDLLLKDIKGGCVVGVGGVESSFLVQSSPGPLGFEHPDFAPLMVSLQYFTQLEGPMWRLIRGAGLAYSYNIYPLPQEGKIQLTLYKASNPVAAFDKSKNIIEEFLAGGTLEVDLFQSAKSSLMFEIIDREKCPASVVLQSILLYFKKVGDDYNSKLVCAIDEVTVEDARRVARTWLPQLFDVNKTVLSIVCHPTKVKEIAGAFKTMGFELNTYQSLEDSHLNK